jgi:hypothetical protein
MLTLLEPYPRAATVFVDEFDAPADSVTLLPNSSFDAASSRASAVSLMNSPRFRARPGN